jgi:serine/threonine-protein kinase RsbW
MTPVAIHERAPMSGDEYFYSNLDEVRRIQDHIEAGLRAAEWEEMDIFGIKLANEEGLVNAVKHGNEMDPTKRVHVVYSITYERYEITITDEGNGFNPADVPDPTEIENLERPCGRGLLLMRSFMTEITYNAKGNSVYMLKVRAAKE